MKNSKSINFKSVLTKSLMAAGVTLAGLVALNTTSTHEVHAAVTANDPQYVTVNYLPNYGVTVWDSYKSDRHITGEYLQNATTWKVYDVEYDQYGNKWYNIGENENKWVLGIFVKDGANTAVSNTTYAAVATQTTTAPVAPTTQSTNTVANTTPATSNNYNSSKPATSYTPSVKPATSYNYSYATNNNNAVSNYSYHTYSAPKTNTVVTTTQSTSSYTSNVSGSEASAKAWIAGRESGGSYTARNGQYVGKYQLSASYLNGDYSAANQERVADNYVKSRYGSWTAAQSFWQANGWY